MVAKATQNLFDVNIGGAGFHVSAHLIALVALFIACFAIAGYISFRGNSIPVKALRDQNNTITKTGDLWRFEREFELTSLLNATGVVQKTGLVLPSGALVTNATLFTTRLGVGTGGAVDGVLTLGDLNISVGNAVTNETADITADGNLLTNPVGVADSLASAALPLATAAQQEVYFTVDTAFTAVTTTPKIIATVEWIGPAPVSY